MLAAETQLPKGYQVKHGFVPIGCVFQWTILVGIKLMNEKQCATVDREVNNSGVLFFFLSLNGDKVDRKDGLTTETPSEVSEHPKGFYVETVIIYKEDFVPITEKILKYWKSWTGGPGAEP
nr:small integral membrane protein 26-like [Macaca nemestrina]